MNTARIKIEGAGDNVILAGTAATTLDGRQGAVLATPAAGGADTILNSIVLCGARRQLMVSVCELAHTLVKELGIDLSAKLNRPTAAVSFRNPNPFTAPAGRGSAITRRRPPSARERRCRPGRGRWTAGCEAFEKIRKGKTVTCYPGLETAKLSDIGK